jgi:hypothetical protein
VELRSQRTRFTWSYTPRDNREICYGTRLDWLRQEQQHYDAILRCTNRRQDQPLAAVPPPPPVPPDLDDGREYSYEDPPVQPPTVANNVAATSTLIPLTPFIGAREITLTGRVLVSYIASLPPQHPGKRVWPYDIIVLILKYTHGEPLW